jgi:hypothetical protein
MGPSQPASDRCGAPLPEIVPGELALDLLVVLGFDKEP